MKKRYSEEQIIKAIKQHEAGAMVDDICRELGISNGTFYSWRSKYAGLEVNEAKRLRELESENAKLKKLPADKLLEVEAIKDVLAKVVKPDRKRPIVARLVEHFQLSEPAACQQVGLSRTGYRYKAKPKDDRALRARLKTLAAQHSRYGYLLLHGLLKAEGLVVDKKRIYRAYTEEGLQGAYQDTEEAPAAASANGSANSS